MTQELNLPVFQRKSEVKLGVMGGTFDPIHFGHLVTAEHAREALNLDCVLFMPAAQPANKEKRGQVSSAQHRLNMTSLAIKDNEYFDISALEIDRGGITYTIDTLRQLREYYSDNVTLYFITGADAIIDIVTWRDAKEIANLAIFVAATRPGYDLQVAKDVIHQSPYNFCVNYIEIPALSISSTYLRNRIASGSNIRYLTPPAVIEYIEKHRLYVNLLHPDFHEVIDG